MKVFYFFLFFINLYANEFLNSGSWFSEKEVFQNGFSYQSLYLKKSINDEKFILSIINFNQIKLWEETRINGKIQKISDEDYILKPEICSVYASKKLGQRWTLFRSVDCDHIALKLQKKGNEFILESIFDKEIKLLFSRPISNKNDTIFAKIIFLDSEFYGWSVEARKLRKKSKAVFLKNELEILESVDSTIKLKYSDKIKLDSIFEIENGKPPSIFD